MLLGESDYLSFIDECGGVERIGSEKDLSPNLDASFP
jgi:hypothetical protein